MAGFGKQKTQVISHQGVQELMENEMGAPFTGSKNQDGKSKNAEPAFNKPRITYGNWGENAGGKTQTEVDPGPRSKG